MQPPRGRYQGVWQILRFNWPMYVAAAVVLGAGAALLCVLPLPGPLRALALIGLALAAFWLLVSFAVSHYVYDLAGIYDGDWLLAAITEPPRQYANLHAGFDEFSPILAARFPTSTVRVLDFFDATQMTEPSIARARKGSTTHPSCEAVDYRALPMDDAELDAAFLIFAAHELRDKQSRVQLLRELRRALKPGGQLVIAEHLRDAANFLAFGPGFLHFHARAEWLRNLAAAELRVTKEFSLTPFVRVLVVENRAP